MTNFITKNTDKNIYQLLNPVDYDPNSIFQREFILQSYQVIPKYYFLSSSTTSLVLCYALGSGKSSCAVFVLLNYLNLYKMFIFNNKFAPKSKKDSKINNLLVNRNVFVIGGWQTQAQLSSDLLRPEFSFITEEQHEELETLLNSPILEQRQDGELLRNKLMKQIEKYINFYGYQSFFNNCFPGIQEEKYHQNAVALIREYEQGNISINEEFLNKLKNSIVVIDEMQRLYSINGLNSYGFAIMMVSKISKIYDIKLLFLSGTIVNTSLTEIIDILNIIMPNKKLLKIEDYMNQTTALDNILIYEMKKEKMQETLDMFYDKFMYYNPNAEMNKERPRLLNFKQLSNEIKDFYSYGEKDCKFITYSKRKALPIEINVGNSMINDVLDLQPMILYSVEVEGYQKEQYKKYIEKVMQMSSSEFEQQIQDDKTIYIQDAFLPTSNLLSHGIIENENGIFIGRFLKLNNLRKYSAIGYEMCNMCRENTWHNEKTVLYHSKLKNFGIFQYAEILKHNGFIKYGDKPQEESLCKICKNTYSSHSDSLEERLKHKVCNTFTPMVFSLLIGELNQSERDKITTSFNSPLNIYGDIISIMFVSDVAYSGVSFFNTNNIILLSRISNISKWRQIAARIIRTQSHALLPLNKHYAKVYTMIINYPDEIKTFKLKQYTIGERYYKIHELLNVGVEKYIRTLSTNCIGYELLNHPDKLKITEKENIKLNNLFISDLDIEIKIILRRIIVDYSTSIWKFNTLIKRIKDPKYATSFMNLETVPLMYLENLILKSELIELFKFVTPDKNDTIWAKINTYNNDFSINNISSFPFSKLYNINISSDSLNSMIHTLENSTTTQIKIKMLQKILSFTNKKFSLLVDKKPFWDAIFEIGDEYYDDDESMFFENHMKKNRNISKMTGFYYGEIIVFKNGTYKPINYKFPMTQGWKNIPFLFKITCLVLTETSPFFLHVSIIKINDDITDKRKISKGIVCTSIQNINDLQKYFPELNNNLTKKMWCSELLYLLCEKQFKNSTEKAVFSPFEK